MRYREWAGFLIFSGLSYDEYSALSRKPIWSHHGHSPLEEESLSFHIPDDEVWNLYSGQQLTLKSQLKAQSQTQVLNVFWLSIFHLFVNLGIGPRDGSVFEDTWFQARWPEFDPWNSHGRRQKPILTICPPTSTCESPPQWINTKINKVKANYKILLFSRAKYPLVHFLL